MAEYFFFFQGLLTEWNLSINRSGISVSEDISDDFKKTKFKVNFTNFNILIVNKKLQLI